MYSCYTQVILPKVPNTNHQPGKDYRQIEFYKTVIDTFDNNWLPDSGYYYEFRPSQNRKSVTQKELLLERLYAEGYNIVAAWYRPGSASCKMEDYFWPSQRIMSPIFIILLSNIDDSIINYNFYGLIYKPEIICPYNVEKYTPEWVNY
jgi:hypothetical protein